MFILNSKYMFHCYGKWEQNMVVNPKYPPCIVSFYYFAGQSARFWARRKETREKNSYWEDKTYKSSPSFWLSTFQAPAMLPWLVSIPCSEHIPSCTIIIPAHDQPTAPTGQWLHSSPGVWAACQPRPALQTPLSSVHWTSFSLLGLCNPGPWVISLSLTLSTEKSYCICIPLKHT